MIVVEAWWDLAVARAALWLLPWRSVPRTVTIAAAPRSGSDRPPAVLASAVLSASRAVPRATCLVQALALQAMLGRRRRPSELKLGVRRSAGFEAHAWLEVDGAVVIGERPSRPAYEPLARVSRN